ncbi:MAG TPA: hypothetical protein VMP41_01175 [Acidimicrobiales bacterium]|nr:hypothetical protein [Acidimicrobiales bacterium]
MRRLLPWALLGLLTLGVAVGAVFGQLESPAQTPAQWVADLVAATQAAGTAHLQFSNVTTSGVSQASKSAGIGVIDFSNGDFRLTTLLRQQQFESTNGGAPRLTNQIWSQETIAIGQTVYNELNASQPFGGWAEGHYPRVLHQEFGLGVSGAEDAVAGLAGPTPVDAVHPMGPASVGGVPATRYAITTEPLYVCGAHGRTLYVRRFAPTTLWVDGQGRLLRAQTPLHFPGYTSHGPRDASGFSQPIVVAPSTTIATLTFSHFGAPVHIAAPPVNQRTGSSIAISLSAKGSTSPCHR